MPPSVLLLLLLLLLSCSPQLPPTSAAAVDTGKSAAPFAFVCNILQDVSVVFWPAADNSSVDDSRAVGMGHRLCLLNDNTGGLHMLTNATQSKKLPDGRLHLVFTIPQDIIECTYYYRWKISEGPASEQECNEKAGFSQCFLEIGRSSLCPGWSIRYPPIECLQVPQDLQFLLLRCRITPPPPPPPQPNIGLIAGVCVAAVLVAAGCGLLIWCNKPKPRPWQERPKPKSVFLLLDSWPLLLEFFSSHRPNPGDWVVTNWVDPDTHAQLLPAAAHAPI